MYDIEENTEDDIRKFRDEIFNNMIETFDLLKDINKLELFLSLLTKEQLEQLYSHKLLDEYDLLP